MLSMLKKKCYILKLSLKFENTDIFGQSVFPDIFIFLNYYVIRKSICYCPIKLKQQIQIPYLKYVHRKSM